MLELSEEYLSRFPGTLRECLKDENQRIKFARTAKAVFEPIIVFRMTHNKDKVNEYDFLDNVRDYYCRNKGKNEKYRKSKEIGSHSVSVNESKEQMIASFSKFPNGVWKGIAVGLMVDIYGPADFKEGESHHGWYLFEGANKEAFLKFKMYEE